MKKVLQVAIRKDKLKGSTMEKLSTSATIYITNKLNSSKKALQFRKNSTDWMLDQHIKIID